MKTLPFLLLVSLFMMIACEKNEQASPKTSDCIEAKIAEMRDKNAAYTSVVRYEKNNESYWLFDSGSAFDAPKYMLNISCDTVCKWCRCWTHPVCQSDFNLNDSTAVIIWKH